MLKNGNLTYFEAVFDNFCNGVQVNHCYEYNKQYVFCWKQLKTGWRNSLFKVKVKVIKTAVHDFLKFGIFMCFGPISGWKNETK